MQHDDLVPEKVKKVNCDEDTGEGGDDAYDCARYGLMEAGDARPAGTITDVKREEYRPQRPSIMDGRGASIRKGRFSR
jgi:hypothetical protein